MDTFPDRNDRNPFTPPESGFATLGGPVAIGRYGRFDVDDVVRTSWALFKQNPWRVITLVIGVGILNWLMQFGLGMIPNLSAPIIRDATVVRILSVFASLASMILSIWLSIGLNRALLRYARSEPVEFSEVGNGGPYLLTVILGSLAMGLIMVVPATVLGGGIAFVMYSDPPSGPVLAILGVLGLASLLTMIYVLIRLNYFMFICFDHDTGVIDSLRGSWEATKGRVVTLILISLAQMAINLLGMLALCVGLFVTVPLTSLMYTVTYDKMVGGPPAIDLGEVKPGTDPDWSP